MMGSGSMELKMGVVSTFSLVLEHIIADNGRKEKEMAMVY